MQKQQRGLAKKIRTLGLAGLLLTLSSFEVNAQNNSSLIPRIYEFGLKNNAAESARRGNFIKAQNEMNAAKFYADMARVEEEKQIAEAGRNSIVINNNSSRNSEEQSANNSIPEYRFISCSQINEIEKGVRSYPESYKDIGKSQFKSGDALYWVAIINHKKNSVLSYKNYINDQQIEQDAMVLTEDYASISIRPDTSCPGNYRIEWYLDGGSMPLGVLDTIVKQNTESETKPVNMNNKNIFVVCNGWQDGGNGGILDNKMDYPREFLGLGKDVFSLEEHAVFYAFFNDATTQNSVWQCRVLKDGTEIDRHSGIVKLHKVNAISSRTGMWEPGNYRIEWYFDGNAQPVGLNEMTVESTNSLATNIK